LIVLTISSQFNGTMLQVIDHKSMRVNLMTVFSPKVGL